MTTPLSKEYLLNRGVCCGSGCKNCPYYPKHTRGAIKTDQKAKKSV